MTRLDPRLAFLARAGARATLVEVGEITLDEAIRSLIHGQERCPLCGLRRHLLAAQWERTHPPLKYRRRGGRYE
jgi:hypothetical protein